MILLLNYSKTAWPFAEMANSSGPATKSQGLLMKRVETKRPAKAQVSHRSEVMGGSTIS